MWKLVNFLQHQIFLGKKTRFPSYKSTVITTVRLDTPIKWNTTINCWMVLTSVSRHMFVTSNKKSGGGRVKNRKKFLRLDNIMVLRKSWAVLHFLSFIFFCLRWILLNDIITTVSHYSAPPNGQCSDPLPRTGETGIQRSADHPFKSKPWWNFFLARNDLVGKEAMGRGAMSVK